MTVILQANTPLLAENLTARTDVPVPPVSVKPGDDYSAAITAWATVALVLATGVLAYLTWVLARATRRASIVVTIEPNPAALNFVDMHVFNEGNVAAYDIQIDFDPPLPDKGGQFDEISYPSRIAMFSAGQRLISSLCETFVIIDSSYQINISWLSTPKSRWRQSVSYRFDLSHLKGVSTLGKDPNVQSADEIKKIRELIDRMASGRNRIKVDAYSQDDRNHEREKNLAGRLTFGTAQPSEAPEDLPASSLAAWFRPAHSLMKWVKLKISSS